MTGKLWRSYQPWPNCPHGPPRKRSSWLGCCSASVSSLFHDIAFFSNLLSQPNTARPAITGVAHSKKHARRNRLRNLVSCFGLYRPSSCLHLWITAPTSMLLKGRRSLVEILKHGQHIPKVLSRSGLHSISEWVPILNGNTVA